MLSHEQIQHNWPRIKTQVLAKWNKLSEADIEKTHGNANAIHHLVSTKYGNIPDFDKTYERMCESCIPSSKKTSLKTEIEDRPKSAPSAEAGMHASTTEKTDGVIDDTFHAGSPERRANANYAHLGFDEGNSDQDQRNDHGYGEEEREFQDELSAYSPGKASRVRDDESSSEFIKLDNDKKKTQFTAPDEFYPSQDPTPTREDVTLGRNTSSATKISTAKAASNSSEVSFNDAKKKT